ncbi:hypothetical protein E2562_018575 [Oryza meyeriana var. granulata]|uniref:Hydroxyproline-rich glycoprotein family protein n=1 Tax=Oryza meyeriana var. granulata TaxID=110450 RepID=A0A6G1F9J1_9ORYZ|nr:hypothetical protein E2562_018575 [Oryza meyeriana var. granulata]
MAPCILHRASSFSNLPVHRHHFSTFQEASGVSNRHEGLALLTTIVEGDGNCNPASDPLPKQSLLSTSLINKILHLIDALDLPCQRSCVPLDQLLLDTLEALKIAYPKCLSGLSAYHNTSYVQQSLAHLHEVLRLVQGCHSEQKQSRNSVSDKHTATVNQSFEQVGERVIEMLDQVTPFAKQMFSSMENSKNSIAVWPEDLPERRNLPPVHCRPWSPSRHEIAGYPLDIAADVGTSCKDGVTVKTMDQGICSKQTGQSEPPQSTPTGDYSVLQTTPSSVSPHPLSAPPPSPVPVEGLPMLFLSWEAMQDCNPAVPMVASPAAQPVQAAALAAQHGMSIAMGNEGKDEKPSSTSAGEAQPTSLAQQQSVDANAAAAIAPPPPLPSTTNRGPSIEPVQTVANAPAPAPAKGPSAPPPPPPGAGNLAKALRAKKAATKLKRSTQMGSMYRHLRDRVEGGTSYPHGVKSSHDKKARAAPATGGKGGGAGQGMADALAEMTKRSAYFRQIEEDVGTHTTAILELKDAIGAFQSKDMGELARFHHHVEQQLTCLTDETQVLARFEGFPSMKLETLRMAAALYSKLDGIVATLKSWKLQAAAPVSPQLDRVEAYFNKIKDEVDTIERSKDDEMKRFVSHNVQFDFGILVRIKECMVDLSSSCVELALEESQDANDTVAAQAQARNPSAGVSRMLWRVFQLAFRVYNFAGGQDERADRLTSTLAREIEAHASRVT